MGLFSSPKVPNTISDKEAAKLQLRAARKEWFTKKAIEQRKASEQQRSKSRWS